MIELGCEAVLLDVEGTVAPVTFVYDVMFPFARRHVDRFLKAQWETSEVQEAVDLIAKDIGKPSSSAWFEGASTAEQQDVVNMVVGELMDEDSKATGLKQLQGLIWRSGFENGELVSMLFDDVLPRIKLWKKEGLELYIYSSGSVDAQRLFFGHTTAGNLLDLFSGHFDTKVGAKNELGSYTKIAKSIGHQPEHVLFISDSLIELEAAKLAGMQTIWRPDDPSKQNANHTVITSFAEIRLRDTANR